MKEQRPLASPIRFGVYEVDLVSEELRKNGLKIRLGGQPFQILAMLLERPGGLVTREELHKKLWPDGTFVDFDHSLNTAINKIREALGDSAENPRFVETLARRGYRFIAPVEILGSQRADLHARQTTEPGGGTRPVGDRRQRPLQNGESYDFGPFRVDVAERVLTKGPQAIPLTPKAFDTLVFLIRNSGHVVDKDELLKQVWPDTFVEEGVLAVNVAALRKALNEGQEGPSYIETVPRRGYRFTTDVRALERSPVAVDNPHRRSWRDSSRFRKYSIITTVMVLFALVVGARWWFTRHSSLPGSGPKLARITSNSGLTYQPALSPDASLVAYSSDRGREGNLDIWLQQVSGGEPLRRTDHEAADYAPTFSPDGGQIAFRSNRSEGGIYVMPVLGGEEKLLIPRGHDPRFSPDGKWVAAWEGIRHGNNMFGPGSWGNTYIVSASDGLTRQIAKDFRLAVNPVWSPDGKRLLVYGGPNADQRREETLDWWVISTEGEPAVRTGALEVLRRQGHTVSLLDVGPYAAQWIGDHVFFFSRWGDSVNLWQIPISSANWKVARSAQRLTFGTGLEIHPSVAGNQIVFASLSENVDLWSLPIDTNQGKVAGEIQRLTQDVSPDDQPSMSLDGKRLAFRSLRSGNADIWLKDLETGKATSLVATPLDEDRPKISDDGTKVAYTSTVDQKSSIHLVAATGGAPEKMCEDCDLAWDLSRDGQEILYKSSGQNSVWLLRTSSGQKTEFLQHSRYSFWQASFSPDNQWIGFLVSGGGVSSHVRVMPLRHELAVPESEWVAITKGEPVDKPRWSPDGNWIYFTSHRDGFRCLWAQRLEPSTKRPIGLPTDICHFHSVRRSLLSVGHAFAEVSVAGDKIVFPLGELTGNIWMTKLDLN